MDLIQLERDYQTSRKFFKDFQNEVFTFLNEIIKPIEEDIHIVEIIHRPEREIKSLESIKTNIKDAKKYQKYESIFDIKDIVGLRITCHCEDDVEKLSNRLEGELKQRYSNVSSKPRKADDDDPYWGVHLYFSKPAKIEEKVINLFCEIQIRTVLANAWAIQSHKYLYKTNIPGEPQELSIAVSEIMNGCEKLWSLVKSMSKQIKRVKLPEKEKATAETGMNDQIAIRKDLKPIEAVKNWMDSNRTYALNGINKLEIKTYMEVLIIPVEHNERFGNDRLIDSAQRSTIKTFGWPIGLFSVDREEFAIKSNINSIHVEIALNEPDFVDPDTNHKSYDFWTIHESASFYLLKSLFEDQRKQNRIFFDTRIIRITEVLMYLEKLYTNLGFPKESLFELTIRHIGLEGRVLSSANPSRDLPREYKANKNEVKISIQASIEDIQRKLPDIVEEYTAPLFESFESFKLEKTILENLVSNFYRGRAN